jgi:pre-mRNA-splicing factor CDC5/CEF1
MLAPWHPGEVGVQRSWKTWCIVVTVTLARLDCVSPGTPLRTPRAQNTVLLEAQDALARNAMQTPLRGEDNADVRMERATGAMPTPKLGGATPSLKEAQTPRTGSGATPASTPARLFPGETPSGKRSNVEKLQQQMAVRSMLEGLPAPENEVEISMPDEPEMPPEEPGLAEDQEEIEARKIKKAMAMRSAAVKQDLPRPLAPKMAQRSSEADSAWEAASELVFAEMQDLVMRDHILYPQKKEKEGKKKILKAPPELESFSQADLKAAAELLQEECKELTPADGAMPTWALELPYLFVPSEKGGDWVLKAEVKPEDQIRALAKEFDSLVKRHDKEKVRIEKVEKKLELMLGGYLNRCGEARGRLGERHQECMSLDADLEAFQRLEELEKAAMRRRVEELEERLKAATEANNDAQKEYRELEETRVKLDKALG